MPDRAILKKKDQGEAIAMKKMNKERFRHNAVCGPCGKPITYISLAEKPQSDPWCPECLAWYKKQKEGMSKWQFGVEWKDAFKMLRQPLRGWVACVVWWDFLADDVTLFELLHYYPYSHSHSMVDADLAQGLRTRGEDECPI